MGIAKSKFLEDDPCDSCRGDHPKLEFTYEINVAGVITHHSFVSSKLKSSRSNFMAKPLTRKALLTFRPSTT